MNGIIANTSGKCVELSAIWS